MNPTKFEFNGKFYKQKFGTLIGYVISPMLVEIIMEDFNGKKCILIMVTKFWSYIF